MAKEWAEGFYKSRAWQECRDSFIASRAGLCEDCAAQGDVTPAEIAHHITELTQDNINDPAIALSWNNLRAVCRRCHAVRHGASVPRYSVDGSGRITGR